MRWFKHLTDASDDEFIHSIEQRFGLNGYARWWKLCEIVGRRLKPSDTKASTTLPWHVWETNLKAKRKQLRSFLEAIEKERRIIINDSGDVLTIELPKLLKYRDEYLRKSGQGSGQAPKATPDKVPSKNIDTDTENRSKKNQKTTSRKDRATRCPDPFVLTDELRAWSAAKYPQVDLELATEDFCDYWRGVPGSKGTKLDWLGTWRNAIRRASTRRELLRNDHSPPSRSRPISAAPMNDE